MEEVYVTAYELSCITGKALPAILKDLRDDNLIYHWKGGTRMIPLSQLYKTETEPK